MPLLPPGRFVDAAKALARLVTDEDRAAGALFPPVAAAGEVAVHVGAAVAARAYAAGIATELPRPHDLLARAETWKYKAACEHPGRVEAVGPAEREGVCLPSWTAASSTADHQTLLCRSPLPLGPCKA